MRSLGNLDLSAIRRQHPHRNFQASPRWVDDRYSAISPLRPADHLKRCSMERMEWIEDLDGRVFYAQGIVSVDASILISISSFPPAASPPITPDGFAPETNTSSPRKSCAESFAANSATRSSRRSRTASCTSRENSSFLRTPKSSLLGYGHCTEKIGWSI